MKMITVHHDGYRISEIRWTLIGCFVYPISEIFLNELTLCETYTACTYESLGLRIVIQLR